MELIQVYKCLCDLQRLRILNLLKEGPLCVCHIQGILGESQVRTSTHLAYMRKLGLVEATRQGTWMIYSIARPAHPLLMENLKCLQDCVAEHPEFASDLEMRRGILADIEAGDSVPAGVRSEMLNPRCCCR